MIRLRLIVFLLILSITCFSQVRPLSFFILRGLSNSPLITDLSNQAHSNSLDSLIVKANRLPQVNFDALLSFAPVINEYGYSEAITNGGNFITVINVSQPLFNKKNVEAQYAKLGLQNQSLYNSVRLTERELKKTITAQYLNSCSVYSDITVDKNLLKKTKEEEILLKLMVNQGVYRQTDYLSFVVELQSLELHLIDLQTQYMNELYALNVLCGINDTTTYDLELPELSPVPVNGRSASPFFKRFTIDSLRIRNEQVLIDGNYVPKIGWYSDAGVVNSDPAILYKNFGISLGLSFSVPVFDGNQRKLNYEKLKMTEQTRGRYRDFFNIQYGQQLLQLNAELKRTRDLIPRINEQLEVASAIISQDRELLNYGRISVTDYVIALKNYQTIQANSNQCRIRILQIQNEINYWTE